MLLHRPTAIFEIILYAVRFRITLHLEVTKGLFSINNKNLPEMNTFAPYEETGSGIFFSLGDSLHYWSASTRNQSLLLEGNVVINNLYYLNPTKVIVSRADAVSLYIFNNETLNLVNHLVCDQQQQNQLTSGNCTQTTDSKLGPTAIEYSKPNILYYADGPSVYQVNMLDPNSKADEIPNLNKSLGNITAMAVSQDLLFTIHKTNSTQTFSTNNLTTSKPTRSLWSIEYPSTILQAVHLGNGVLLCRSQNNYLALLDTYTGYFSTVYEGTTHLPCDSSECGQNPIELKDLISYNSDNNIHGLVNLYGVDGSQKPVTLHYNSKYTK